MSPPPASVIVIGKILTTLHMLIRTLHKTAFFILYYTIYTLFIGLHFYTAIIIVFVVFVIYSIYSQLLNIVAY